jgi:hypothetical protein
MAYAACIHAYLYLSSLRREYLYLLHPQGCSGLV